VTDPGPIGFSSSTEKKLEYGWSKLGDEEQFYERLTRNMLQLDAEIHHQFAFDPDGSHQLTFAHFGGVYDDGAAWQLAPDGTLLLPDDTAAIYIERDIASGGVIQNLVGFTYAGRAPMCIVTTAHGEITDVVDRRPHDVAGGGGGGGGCVTFPCLAGVILDAQVPLTAVKQYESFLAISFTQMTDSILDAQVPESAVTQHEAALSLSFTQMYDFLTEAQIEDADEQLGARIIGSASTLSELVGYLLSRVAQLQDQHESIVAEIPEPFTSFAELFGFLLSRATRRFPHEQVASNFNFV